jgi:hypothetical protein
LRLRIGLGALLIARIRLWPKRQFYADAQASTHAAGKADLSAMLPDDRTSYRETEPDAASVRVARIVNSVERFEDLLALTRWYSGSLVLDRYDDVLGFGAQADSGAPPRT